MQHFEDEWTEKNRLIYQIAQNTFQTYLLMFMLGGTPKRSVEDFVMEFEVVDPHKKVVELGRSVAEEAKQAKVGWQQMVEMARVVAQQKRKDRPQKVNVKPPSVKPRRKR